MDLCVCVFVRECIHTYLSRVIRVINAKSLSFSSLLNVTKLGLMLQAMNFIGVYEILQVPMRNRHQSDNSGVGSGAAGAAMAPHFLADRGHTHQFIACD